MKEETDPRVAAYREMNTKIQITVEELVFLITSAVASHTTDPDLKAEFRDPRLRAEWGLYHISTWAWSHAIKEIATIKALELAGLLRNPELPIPPPL